MARRGYYKEGTQTRITGSDSYVSFAASDKGKADRAGNAMRKIYGMGGPALVTLAGPRYMESQVGDRVGEGNG